MKIYLVGGAVRDKLLNLPTQDRDWVVTGATSTVMLDQGYLQVGKDFPVFLHPESKEEYALARIERKIDKGYHGFECIADPEVTLEQDLMRRDLTINAIAEDSQGNIIDPYNGRADLEQGILRHVSEAFAEDPVRILRIARFAARFAKQQFYVAHSTNKLMKAMVTNGEVNALAAERCWAETYKALTESNPLRYFQVLRGCGALAIVFPEIEQLYPAKTHQVAHNKQTEEPGIFAIFSAALDKSDPAYAEPIVRFAILMLGLYLHTDSQDTIKTLCQRMRVPTDYHDLAITASRILQTLMSHFEFNAESILDLFSTNDALRKPERFKSATIVCCAFPQVKQFFNPLLQLPQLLDDCATVNARDIDISGLKGKEIGLAIHKARLELLKSKL